MYFDLLSLYVDKMVRVKKSSPIMGICKGENGGKKK